VLTVARAVAGLAGRTSQFQRPIVQSTIFDLGTSDDAEPVFLGVRKGYGDSRFGNPSVEGLAPMIADLEGGSEALITSSSNAAVLCAVTAGLDLIPHAVSLGGMESRATRPAMPSHRGMTS